MASETVLVTGGAGFIGSHVAEELVQQGRRVVVLDDLSGGFADNIPRGAVLVEGSIVDPDLVNRLFQEHRFRHVFHLAAYAAEGLSHFIRRFNYTNNVIGSMNLINAAVNHDVECFVFASSIAVYGSAPLPMTEQQHPQPIDPYGIAKYAVELDLAAARALFGLNSIIFRLHNVYGARQNTGDRYRNVIGIFFKQALSGRPLTVFGDGGQTRAFTDVADVAPVIARSISIREAYNETFNLGADVAHSVRVLAERVQSALGVDTGIQHLEPREEVLHAFADHAKARSILKYVPQVDLDTGLKRMAAWVKRHGVRTSKDFGAIEISRNLPPAWRQ